VALNLASAWADEGHEVYLVSIRDVSDYAHLIPSSVRHVCLGVKRVRYSVPPLRRTINQIRPDGILSVIRDSNILIAISMPPGTGTHIVFREASTLHAVINRPWIIRVVHLWLLRIAYLRADVVVSNSNDTQKDLVSRGIARKNGCVIPNPVLPRNYRSLCREPVEHAWLCDPSIQTIVSAGRLSEAKDFSSLLMAFSIVYAQRPNLRLVILGQGEEEAELKRLAQDLGIARAVDFAGFVENPWAYYSRSDVFALCSRWEGFGNVIVEALATGTTVVVTDCPGGPGMIVGYGKYGYLAPVGRPESFAHALERALDSPLDPKLLVRRAEEFSVRRISQLYLSALDKRIPSKITER